jgi:2-polyprenyl-6-hydroxyphenyl methylase/3-demethylubiquinone-9 3-methyltransferase
MSDHASEITRGQRFEFGANWRRFLDSLTPERIAEAERSLREMLACQDLHGRSFLDVGSGSGLFSLAAYQLGACVRSFDFDPQSVACTESLRERFAAGDGRWQVQAGSALDARFLAGLGTFDVVYAWGVLHHTGDMWQALANMTSLVAPGGQLFLAIYNHQPLWTPPITLLKRTYVASPRPIKLALAASSMAFHAAGGVVRDLFRFRNPLARYRNYDRLRGMSWWHDQLDWVGGYPFETATPAAITGFYEQRGFRLERIVLCRQGSSGCNQFVLRKEPANG